MTKIDVYNIFRTMYLPIKYENSFHTNKIAEAFSTIPKQDITTLPHNLTRARISAGK